VAILLASRAGGRYLAILAGMGVLCLLCSPYAFKIDMAAANPAVVVGIPELSAVLLICAGVIVLRPRLWIIDRLGVPARRWIPATSAALVTIGGPQLALAIAAAAQLRRETWPPSATTVLFLAGLTVLGAPFLGALRASSLMMASYFAVLLAAQLLPAIGEWSPLAVVSWPAVQQEIAGKVAFAAVVTGGALVVTVRTLGRTPRTWGRDFDTA
jgi:hypothetical protein